MEKALAIVDDNQMVVEALRMHLKNVFPELTIKTFSNGKQILKAMSQDLKVDVVIMDGRLLDGDTGPTYAHEIVMNFPDVVVIGFSNERILKEAFLKMVQKNLF
ncbi:hypothetical protein A2V49_01800 [candidate division WWE3 bacterium RBG_19FT_COMBO_34_6]|uniref:Response regulatory domain-containing protein n=1 Tax=candidate division WWE3 bacterium RBG_19FT_COMBO_34_6 TaxID=1802612 RepID=A0A1F4UMJ2_UNCKA|nr:MAG: hypothetical protein A2V49_01800 [candidate division WWE3 bacterium RBG_19FT_COMBO_34_6]